MEWRRVSAEGRFLHDKEAYVYATEFDLGLGVHVLTPLVMDGGGVVLVDRGFVPLASRPPETRAAGPSGRRRRGLGDRAASKASATCLRRPPMSGQRIWYWRDIEGIARTLGVMLRAPIVIVADQPANPGGLPRFPGYRVDIPNNHLQYALTWFGLALTLVGVYLVYHVQNGRLSFS